MSLTLFQHDVPPKSSWCTFTDCCHKSLWQSFSCTRNCLCMRARCLATAAGALCGFLVSQALNSAITCFRALLNRPGDCCMVLQLVCQSTEAVAQNGCCMTCFSYCISIACALLSAPCAMLAGCALRMQVLPFPRVRGRKPALQRAMMLCRFCSADDKQQ